MNRHYLLREAWKELKLKIQQMRHLVAAADSSSFAQAAKKCFTSRQNIVHSIRELENELDTTLFDRENNALILTPSGQQVVTQAWAILREVDALQNMFSGRGDEESTIIAAVGSNFLDASPLSAVDYLYGQGEAIRFIELDCEACYDAVCSGKADIAFVLSMARSFASCSTIKISSDSAYALMLSDNPLAQKSELTAVDLVDQRLTLMSENAFQYAPLYSELDKMRYDRSKIDVIRSEVWMRHAVESGRCVAVVSKGYVERREQDDALVAVPIADPNLNWNLYALYERTAGNFKNAIRLINEFKAAFDPNGLPGVFF